MPVGIPIDLDSTIALITEEEYAAYRQKEPANPGVDSNFIIDSINKASQFIKSYCSGRIFITPASQIDELFSGDGADSYYTKHGRIADASTIVIDEWDGDSWEVLPIATYGREVDAEAGYIWLHNGHKFVDGQRYRLKYKPGWTIANVPQDIKSVACFLVHRLALLSGGKEGIATESFGDSTTTYNLNNLIGGKERFTLNQYRRRFL